MSVEQLNPDLQVVRKVDFASLLGLHKSRTSQLIRQGMPVREDGFVELGPALEWCEREGRVPVQKIAAARAEVVAEPQEAREAVERLERHREELIPAGDVERQTREWATRIREGVSAIPDRISKQIAGESDEAKVKALLKGEVERFLDEVADAVVPRS